MITLIYAAWWGMGDVGIVISHTAAKHFTSSLWHLVSKRGDSNHVFRQSWCTGSPMQLSITMHWASKSQLLSNSWLTCMQSHGCEAKACHFMDVMPWKGCMTSSKSFHYAWPGLGVKLQPKDSQTDISVQRLCNTYWWGGGRAAGQTGTWCITYNASGKRLCYQINKSICRVRHGNHWKQTRKWVENNVHMGWK